MCGIAGAFNYKNDRPVTAESLKLMSGELVHRGPDDEGYYMNENIGLAFRRLSIIDLHTGNQPIHNEDKTVWVVFNGEIYNYVELKNDLETQGHAFYTKTDTEVIVHLYEQHGTDFSTYLNGMFAIALWDKRKKVLYLLRDRAGIKPLYYAETGEGLMFASEIKALLKAGVSNSPDFEAVNQYLSYGYIPSPLSGFSAIKKLPAGNILICSDRAYKINEFWDYPDLSISEISKAGESELADILIDELQAVIHRQTRSDVPVGIFLSAGVDSALIAAVAAMKCNLNLKAFTVGYTEASYSELKMTRVVAQRLGLSLREIVLEEAEIFKEIDRIIGSFDEPLMDYSMVPTYFVSKLARNHVKTVVGGEGGDELFGGYQTYYLHRIAEFYRKLPDWTRSLLKTAVHRLPESHDYLSTAFKLKRFTYGAEFHYDQGHYRWKILFDDEQKKKLLTADFHCINYSPDSFHAMEKHFIRAREKGFSAKDQFMYVDFKTFLQEDPLQKTDKMSMANSLEVRVPLLDNAIIDFSRRVPLSYKINKFQTKYIMRKALSQFMPPEIAFAKKQGFTPPVALWIKKGLKDYMMSSLSAGALSKVEFLNHKFVASIIDDHLHGRSENSRMIWSLIVLVNWYGNYVLSDNYRESSFC